MTLEEYFVDNLDIIFKSIRLLCHLISHKGEYKEYKGKLASIVYEYILNSCIEV